MFYLSHIFRKKKIYTNAHHAHLVVKKKHELRKIQQCPVIIPCGRVKVQCNLTPSMKTVDSLLGTIPFLVYLLDCRGTRCNHNWRTRMQ